MNELNAILGRALTNAAAALSLEFELGQLVGEHGGMREYVREDHSGVTFSFVKPDGSRVQSFTAGATLDALR